MALGSLSVFRRFLLLLGVVLIAATLAPAPARAATRTITVSGTVVCTKGHSVQGIWVQSSSGGSGFASWVKLGSTSAKFSKSIAISTSSTKIRLDVGCGGTPEKWWSNNRTSEITVTKSNVLNAFCSEAAGTAQRCSWPKTGTSRTYNSGLPNNCTWGALNKFKLYAGYYPGFGGNAWEYTANAQTAGFSVTGTPMAKAIVVFPKTATDKYGHVAWVDSISRASTGVVTLSITEMNYAGNPNYSTRKVTHTSALRYIPARYASSR